VVVDRQTTGRSTGNMTANPSIERTPKSRLRLLSSAAHVER
jgi:hypothetical protein